ncbi:MAG: hypothetical protein JW850_15740 [Thermoflexales bacterium]|nr:hypothetical protein [Thermoflexales bacterium]
MDTGGVVKILIRQNEQLEQQIKAEELALQLCLERTAMLDKRERVRRQASRAAGYLRQVERGEVLDGDDRQDFCGLVRDYRR